jgi:hypothetical protein
VNKQDATELLRSTGDSFFVHLDPRVKDVILPPWIKHQDHAVLVFGDNTRIPIPDLRVDKDGVFGTLDFSRTPYKCFIPWAAVFAVVGEVSGRGMVWGESMPATVAARVPDAQKPWPAPVKKPDLQSVPNCGVRRGPARKGHLKLVR